MKDNYPIPVIDLLDRLVNKTIFSLLDLKSAFYHVRMDEDSIKYTSFVTPLGQFEFRKMPFGLKNAPSTFQRFVNYVFDDLVLAGKVAIYLDDIMVATRSEEEHLEIMKDVFDRLVKNKLELRIDKCHFMKSEIRYLGYWITKDAIRPDKCNINAVVYFLIPRTF